MGEIRKIASCPHCGNRGPQRLVHAQTCDWIGRTLVDGEELKLPLTYFVASCDTCNHVLLYYLIGDDHEDESFINATLEYPDPGRLHPSAPEPIKEIYEGAAKIKRSNPSAFAAQIRRALEALCEERGAMGGNLQQRLVNLTDRGEFPAIHAEAADVLRRLGNLGAHATNKSVKASQVDALDDFFRAIIEYIYVSPSKLKALRESL